MSNLRILYLPIWYPDKIDRLAGSFISDLAHDLADGTHTIDVFYPNMSFKQNGKPAVTIKASEHLTEYICNGWNLPKTLRLGLESWISKSLRIAKKYLTGKYDVIHTHGYVASFLGPAFKAVFGGKLITSLHHSDIVEDQLTKYRKRRLESTLEKYDRVIVPSSALSEALSKTNIFNKHLTIIPNYVNGQKIRLKNTPIDNKKIKCLSVGALERVKNHSELIAAWKHLDKYCTLDIIGNGPLAKSIDKQIKSLNLSSQIRILDSLPKDQLLKKYADYDIFVSMSKVETFGMSMLESIYAGIPVVTTTDNGPNAFINSTNGIICIKEDFILKLKHLIANITDYSPRTLRESVIKFDKSIIVSQMKSTYRELCAE